MLFFVGLAFVLISVFMFIKLMMAAGRPRQEVPVKEYIFAKIKTDLFGMGGNQKHARVSFDVNGQTYETDIFVGKAFNKPVGENIHISYAASNPKDARYYNPKKELVMVIIMFIIGSGICGLSLVISDLISG